LSRRAKCSNGVDSAHDITGRDRGLGRLQRAYRIGVTEHRNCLFEAGQVVGADEHDRWAAVAGDDHAFMFVLDTVDVFREAIFYRSKGLGAHGYNCATAGRRWATVGPGTTMSSLVASPTSQVAQNASFRRNSNWPISARLARAIRCRAPRRPILGTDHACFVTAVARPVSGGVAW
jgi:hypothetical protein